MGLVNFFVKRTVRNQLISAIKDRDKAAINQWVSIIRGDQGSGSVEENVSVFLNDKDKTIPQMVLESSDNYLKQSKNPKWYRFWRSSSKDYLDSQDLTLGLIQLSHEYATLESKPQRTVYQSFIAGIIRLFGVTWPASTANPFSKENLSAELKSHIRTEEKTDNPSLSHREKYTVEQTIEQEFKSKFTINPESIPQSTKPVSTNIPTDWLKTPSLNYQMNQNQQQQQQQTTDQNQQVNLNLGNKEQQDSRMNVLVDNSQIQELNYAVLPPIAELEFTKDWLDFLRTKLSKIAPSNENFTAYLSENAREVLLKGNGIVRIFSNPHFTPDIDLNDLPLGFFLDKKTQDNTIVYVLKFSEAYREYQIANEPGYQLKQDPFGFGDKTNVAVSTKAKRAVNSDTDEESTKFEQVSEETQNLKAEDYFNLDKVGTFEYLKKSLANKGLQLTDEQLSFLKKMHTKFVNETNDTIQGGFLEKENWFLKYQIGVDNYNKLKKGVQGCPFTRTVAEILNHSTNEEFTRLIDLWVKLHKKNVSNSYLKQWNKHSGNPIEFTFNLFDMFNSYLINLKDPREYNNPATYRNIERLLQLDDLELSHFYLLSTSTPTYIKFSEGWHTIFNETIQSYFYLIDYCKSQDIPITTKNMNLDLQHGVHSIKVLLNIISLSKNPRLQAKYIMHAIPAIGVGSAVALLKSGYCMFVSGLLLDDKFDFDFKKLLGTDNKDDLVFISREVFEKIEYHNLYGPYGYMYFRALFLRYLAYNVSAEDMDLAIQKWEKLIPEMDGQTPQQYTEQLANIWPKLKEIALSYPSRMDKKPQAVQHGGFIHEEIAQEIKNKKQYALDDFYRLRLDEEDKEHTTAVINQLNILAEEYSNKEGAELEQEAKGAKEQLNAGTTDLIRILALIREINYRASGHKEWLRIEQITVIYLALTKNRLFQVETSEGKTLIIQTISMLQALQGKKVDILTHNERLAEDSYNTITPYLHLFGLKAATKKSSNQEIVDADVYYSDASSEVINQMFFELELKPNAQPREADLTLIDEVDNIALDIHATTSMQISEGSTETEASAEQEEFLFALNEATKQLIEALKINNKLSKEEQREFMRTQLKDNGFYQKNCANDEKTLDFYISASFTCLHPTYGKVKGTDYVLQPVVVEQGKPPKLAVQIAHKDTTGRIDKIAHWSAGIHQCVAALEKAGGNDVIIPPLTRTLAEGNVIDLLNQYPQRTAFTGSLGDKEEQNKLEELLHTDVTHIMPRAKRPEPEKNVAWPQVVEEDNKIATQYRRGYAFPAQLTKNTKAHYLKLLEGLDNALLQDYSSIVFFNTIDECNEFCTLLENNGFDRSNIQIFDDLNPESDENELSPGGLRPTEATVITRAKDKRMITITTAAGSRGTNFKGVDVGFIAKPGLKRVLEQKQGRIARDTELGVTYEIYNADDVDYVPPHASRVSGITEINHDPRFFVRPFEERKQKQQLESITNRQPLRDYKNEKRADLKKLIKTSPEHKQELLETWAKFNHELELVWSEKNTPENNINKMNQEWEHLFSNYTQSVPAINRK